MTRHSLTWLVPALFMSGCLYVAPIQEGPDPEDTPPYITKAKVSPGTGVVEMELSSGEGMEFMVSGYGDDNEEQTLYHRIVMDFRPAGVSGNSIQATVPIACLPEHRDPIAYLINPCAYQSQYSGAITDGHSMDLYVLLADELFRHQNERFQNADFSYPFETQNGKGAVSVQWTVLFRGECPTQE